MTSFPLLSGFLAESKRAGRHSHSCHACVDMDLINPGSHNGTMEREEELMARPINFRRNPDQLELHIGDFRDRIDELPENPCCEHDAMEMGICPYCSHPELYPGEICIGLHVPVKVYEEMKIFTKRKGVAYSDAGTPLSADYCAVIVGKEELQRILLRASLPQMCFE